MNAPPLPIQPPRAGIGGSVLILLASCLFSAVPFSSSIHPWLPAVSVALLIFSVVFRIAQAAHITFFTAAFISLPYWYPVFRNWPFGLLVPFLLYLIIALTLPPLRGSIHWARAGRLNREILAMVIATAIGAGIALFLWTRLLKPDLSAHLNSMPDMPVWLYPLAGLGFSFGNALLEEFVFRGMFMQALDSALGSGVASIVAQAWLFASVHYRQGFPSGAWGIAMTFVYGIVLGTLRRRSQGILAPTITHVFADMTIFAILTSVVIGLRV